ncbi:MAG: hypothetical protein HYV63_29490, partial [Candidatus Schekmanbacteria bacterium]|nr:hypothetical protein [Candidatus Schekmanbacteria bacterium]
MAAASLEEMWISFLKEGIEMSTEVLEKWATPELAKARAELERLAASPELRRQYEGRIDWLRDYITDMEGSFEDG